MFILMGLLFCVVFLALGVIANSPGVIVMAVVFLLAGALGSALTGA